MGKIYLNSKENDVTVDSCRSQHGYDDMSDEEKGAFDERLNKVVAKKMTETILLKIPNPQMHPVIMNPSITAQIQTNLETSLKANMVMMACLMSKNEPLMKN